MMGRRGIGMCWRMEKLRRSCKWGKVEARDVEGDIFCMSGLYILGVGVLPININMLGCCRSFYAPR